MLKILKNDLFRLRKDFTPRLLLIILVAMTLIFTGVMATLPKEYITSTQESIIAGCFSTLNNSGLIIVIIIPIFVGREFSNLTIRNKIISGQPRYQVYLSMLITTLIYGLIITIVNVLLSLGFSSLVMRLPSLDSTVIKNMLVTFACGTLLFSIYFVFIVTAIFIFRNTGAGIGLTIGIAVAFNIIAATANLVEIDIIRNLMKIVPDYQLSRIIEPTGRDILNMILVWLGFVGVASAAGLVLFDKGDIK